MIGKLKVCPFCGGDAEVKRIMRYDINQFRYFATCTECGVEMPRTSKTAVEAKEKWNRRIKNGRLCKARAATRRY